MHRGKGCEEPATEIALQGLQEESHSAMVANEGIASNSSHSLPVVQALDVPFLILIGDWGVYSTYAFIRKNEYYVRRNLIQVYYGTSFGGMQRYTNSPSRNQCGVPYPLQLETL